MAGLQVLEEQFSAQGFHVLGFFSNDFGMQGGSDTQIDTCNGKYMVTFPELVIEKVINPGARPVFNWILSQPDPGPEPGGLAPTWNFHKYLIGKTGTLVAHFGRFEYWGEDPASTMFTNSPVVQAIQTELMQ